MENGKVSGKRIVITVILAVVAVGVGGCKKPADTTRRVSAQPRRIGSVLPDNRKGAELQSPAGAAKSAQPSRVSASGKPSTTTAAAKKETPPRQDQPYTLYTVKKGDTLMAIARRFYGDASRYKDIAKANNLVDPSKIYVGQVLKIPR